MENKKLFCKEPAAPLSDSDRTALRNVPYRKLVGLLMYIAIGARPGALTSLSLWANFANSSHATIVSTGRRLSVYYIILREQGRFVCDSGDATTSL